MCGKARRRPYNTNSRLTKQFGDGDKVLMRLDENFDERKKNATRHGECVARVELYFIGGRGNL